MTDQSHLTIELLEQKDPRLGRHMVHDDRSRGFAIEKTLTVDPSTWKSRKITIHDPRPNPNQTVGNCTMCAKAMQLNATGNRKNGRVLDMAWAMNAYHDETAHDSIPGTWQPDDTGSTGLDSCKTAQREGVGGAYQWFFGGADSVVQAIVEGKVVSAGTKWYQSMFTQDADGRVTFKQGGQVAGGHEYALRGYDKTRDWVLGRCWWGTFQDFWIARQDLNELLLDGGDAHWQVTT